MTRIGVVGAGRVGAVLAAALRSAGHEVVAVSGESAASRARIEALLPGVAVAPPTAVARACDLLLLTVPDDALGEVATTLAAADAIRSGQQVLHASGKHGLAVLGPAADRGAHVLALHPAMTFTGTEVDLARLPGCRLGITATPATEALAAGLVADLGGVAVRVDEDRRTLYHAGIAHGANHLVTLVAQAADLLRTAGVDDPAGVLRPLLAAVLDNALASGDAALTGPVARGDVDTVRAHLADIAATAPATLDTYAALARATVDRAVLDGRLPAARGEELFGVLDDALARARSGAAR
jgi:predicted short-subunit dehydrogenase-like oxidoreductase (DUF2520 family)